MRLEGKKLVCEGAPAAKPVKWFCWVPSGKSNGVEVMAQTAYFAKHEASKELQCEPGKIELEQLQ